MAFDGITVANLTKELSDTLVGGGISRIIQPEKDELRITIKNNRKQYILVLSANASLPLLYLTDERKEAPLTAPNFSMLLRKHLQGGQITAVTQPSLERVVIFTILHHDELGDLREKKLIIELMGKYSNIIFTDDADTILDAIRRVPSSMSSVREVLPGKHYFIPNTQKKQNPLSLTADGFADAMTDSKGPVPKALTSSFTGISTVAAEEFCYEADIDGAKGWKDLSENEKASLTDVFLSHMADVKEGRFEPNIVYENGVPKEFASFPLRMYMHAFYRTENKLNTGSSYQAETTGNTRSPYRIEHPESASAMLRTYYGAKEAATRMRQKSAELRHAAQTALDRTNKKYQIQMKQMASTEKRDKYRVWGEMLNTYGYSAEEGAKELTCLNYYTNENITVPLDATKTASENAQSYFARYNKLKRTAEALVDQIAETENDREQLEAVLAAIDLAENEKDLAEIRRELSDFGFISKRSASGMNGSNKKGAAGRGGANKKGSAGKKGAKREAKSEPLHFRTEDGFDLYVGRNNYQNEEVTFKIASGNDWWFHAKQAPGSHVIVKTGGRELPDHLFEEAGSLAAYYSSKRSSPKVEIDYTERKHLKKKNGGKPGFVIYHTNYSLMAVPEIGQLTRVN